MTKLSLRGGQSESPHSLRTAESRRFAGPSLVIEALTPLLGDHDLVPVASSASDEEEHTAQAPKFALGWLQLRLAWLMRRADCQAVDHRHSFLLE